MIILKKLTSLIKSLLSRQPVRYIISSCVAFVADYIVLLILSAFLSDRFSLAMEISSAAAFVVSSQINFWINRVWVFKSKKPPLPELGQYYSLAAVSFCVKTFVLLELFTRVFHIPLFIAKPIAEAVMFVVNFAVQKMIIFKNKKENNGDGS